MVDDVSLVVELYGAADDVVFQRHVLLLRELTTQRPNVFVSMQGDTELEYLDHVRRHVKLMPKEDQDQYLYVKTEPFVIVNGSEYLHGEASLLEFMMKHTDKARYELVAAAAFEGKYEVSEEEDTEVVEKALQTRAEDLAASASQMKLRPGRDYVFMNISLDGKELPRLEIELMTDLCPRTCNNFKAFCQGVVTTASGDSVGYKDNIFHRVVRDGWLQAGDVLGQGRGDGPCISLYGEAFEDENYAMKHERIGIVGMASTGPNSNGSQFYITLAPLSWLDKKNVAFGQIIRGYRTLEALKNVETRYERPVVPCTISDCGSLG